MRRARALPRAARRLRHPDAAERRDQSVRAAAYPARLSPRSARTSTSCRAGRWPISALFCIDPFTHRDRRDDGDSGLASDGAVSVRCRGGGAGHRGQRRARDRSSCSTRWCFTAPARTVPAGRAAPSIRCSRCRSSRSRSRCRMRWTARYAGDPALARLFGYDVTPGPSVTAWRERGSHDSDPPPPGLRRTSAPDA